MHLKVEYASMRKIQRPGRFAGRLPINTLQDAPFSRTQVRNQQNIWQTDWLRVRTCSTVWIQGCFYWKPFSCFSGARTIACSSLQLGTESKKSAPKISGDNRNSLFARQTLSSLFQRTTMPQEPKRTPASSRVHETER